MRLATLLAGLALASTALAQIPMPAFGSTFTSTLTRGYWFQAPVAFTIQAVSVPNEAAQPFQVVEIIDLGGAPPPAYPGTVNGTQLFYNNNTPTGSIIPCNINVAAGAYIGILGACTNTVGNTTSYNSYAATAGPFASSILGNPVTLTRFGTQFGIGAGGNQACWQESGGQLSRVDLYAGNGPGVFALAQPYGTGCYRASTSFYENFGTAAAMDLSNSGMSMLNTGSGYLMLPGVTSYVPPSGTATSLVLGDDTEATVALSGPLTTPTGPTSALTICSNGFVSTATGNGTGYTPTVATMLNAANTGWWCWHDNNPSIAGSGQVKFEEVGGIAYVTFDGVWDFGGGSAANANTYQFQFELATGNVHIVWQQMSGLGNGYLVGYSPGGASTDPGNRDISATLPGTFQVGSQDLVPLRLGASGRPLLGTTISLNSTNVPANSPLGVTLFGLTEITAGFNLAGFGMPDCFQYTSFDATQIFLPSGGAGSQSWSIPSDPAFSGVVILSQSAALAPGANAQGVITSNGVRLTINPN